VSSPPPVRLSRRVGIKDVARAAGVSPATVSNVLNHPERVVPAKLERVQKAIDDLGFVRDEAARHLRSGTSSTIGLLLLDAWNPFFTEMARGVEDLAFQRGCRVILSNSARDADRQSAYLQLFIERRIAGLIVVPQSGFGRELAELTRQGIPVVVVDRPDVAAAMSVSLDDVRGGHLGITHLLELGHRRVAFLGNPSTVAQVADRFLGATRGIADFATPVQLSVLEPSDLTVAAGRKLGDQIAAMTPTNRPTAAFAVSDLVALGVLNALHSHGIHVPRDISLVGYDDIEYAAHATVPLTSVRQPAYDMGRAAAELLTDQLSGKQRESRRALFEPELIVRDSTAPPFA
jgi:LacI family transcriptional regulator